MLKTSPPYPCEKATNRVCMPRVPVESDDCLEWLQSYWYKNPSRGSSVFMTPEVFSCGDRIRKDYNKFVISHS